MVTDRDSQAISCPDLASEWNCSGDGKEVDFGVFPPALSLASSCLSIAGSLLVVASYVFFRDFRTGSRRLVTFLAVTNLFQASGCALSAVLYLYYVYVDTGGTWCDLFDTFCQLLGYVTWWATLASFVWTVVLSWYLYSALVKGKIDFVNDYWTLLLLTTSVGPLLMTLPYLAIGSLGYSPLTYGGGCFVSILDEFRAVLMLVLKGFELFIHAFVVIVFVLIFVKSRQPRSNVEYSKPATGFFMRPQMDRKLLLVPGFFVGLRIWSTVLVAENIALDFTHQLNITNLTVCVPERMYNSLFSLSILQALGDPGQGWGNALLFIFLAPKVRYRLFTRPLKRLWYYCLSLSNCLGESQSTTHNDSKVHYRSINTSESSKQDFSSTDADDSSFEKIPTPERLTPAMVDMDL